MSSPEPELPSPPVLVVDDEQSMREFLGVLLRKLDREFATASSAQEAMDMITGADDFAVVITDLKMPGEASGLDVLRHTKSVARATQVVVMTAFATPETAVEAIRQGAYDYITKPFKVEQARNVVERAIEKYHLLAENLYLRQALDETRSSGELIGQSEEMRVVYDLIERVAPTRTTVLLVGESGTGKELAARAIHDRSGREGEFVPVNCGAIPHELIEAELFGYVKGAFTGAEQDRPGLFKAADGGTLFLDEVGELPLSTQVRLLRVLQEHRVKPVGGTREEEVDVRIIAATNRNLQEEVEAGRFREDLFYRLNVIMMELPPLRRRTGDIQLLLEHFVAVYGERIGNDIDGIDSDALRILLSYPYPGNVRELQNIVERAVTLERGDMITVESLPPHLRDENFNRVSQSIQITDEGIDLDEIIENLERNLLVQALEHTEGNRTEAAKLLGISFRSIRYRLSKYGLAGDEG